ncbi:tRNA (adenosine(37)-N6)-dimethylallyltransferase MiaA [Litorilinea aerophila]|uniref:tRNA dimethylallyltransferase n=1 Tax=Litorilinea aerophila TaxID=1204385 RepID=A0A540VER1_9CHLR|nr:tRNA (adenosine(37)-N6)-dimethylallyltransferase MiaA [Litorilinea aerophila]MCC9076994.1 tRNA (adenosine(37)-N6)-dimethylallyltransferase MiaA [Litorilinea aerophila]
MTTSRSLPPLIVLLGPTAVGKTELSLRLCQRFDGEIVNADSRQIYREMAIGTAKPTPEEQARAPHHLVDLRNPDEPLTLAEYQQLAYQAIDQIHARGHLPFLVGGTALYLRAVTQGLRIPEAPPHPQLRAELEAVLAREGREALYARLQTLDPATAAVIDGKNPRRVLRALEIRLITGRPKVEQEGMEPPPYRILHIGLTRPRHILHQRADRRVEEMIRQGLVEETRRLLEAGYDPALPAMTSLGYREIIAYLRGEMSLEEAMARMKVETHRFIRHQYTWFRKMPDVHWFDLEQEVESQIVALIEAFLAPGEGAS